MLIKIILLNCYNIQIDKVRDQNALHVQIWHGSFKSFKISCKSVYVQQNVWIVKINISFI